MVGLIRIIMNPKVWQASGHVDGFIDPMVDCRESGTGRINYSHQKQL